MTHKKSSAKRLEVIVAGQTMRGATSAEVFVNTLIRIGLDRVAAIGLTVGPNLLVSEQAPLGRNAKKCDKWFVVTHSSTREKLALIEQIAERFNIPIRARISEPGDAYSLLL